MKTLLAIICLIPFLAIAKTTPDTSHLLEFEKNTVNVFQKVSNAVVNVSSIKITRSRNFFDPEPLEVPSGAGSGFVWDNKGHIVTNFHVVAGSDYFNISFKGDKKQYKAKIVGTEPKKDIAVLKLQEMPKNLQPITPGNSSSLMVGQKAMAIGNPFGLDHTITSGIISALGRKIKGIGGVKIHGMIQADTSINPGNSGGPLLDSKGSLIGMNTMIFSGSGTSAGVGFAVPVDTIKAIVPQLIKYGKVNRAGLGIGILDDHHKHYFGVEEGIVIKFVNKKSPAGKAGLKGMGRDRYGKYYLGDIITKIDGKLIKDFDDIYHVLEKYKAGDSVTVTYERKGKEKIATIKLTKI
jgi:S1-C subfamily serine protease